MSRHALVTDAELVSTIEIRAALGAFGHIFPATAAKPVPADLMPEWTTYLTHPDTLALISTDPVDAGCLCIIADPNAPHGRRLARLYVQPEHWGCGIARTLYMEALVHERRLGTKALNLWVLEKNQRARSIYESWGWTLVPLTSRTPHHPDVVEVVYELIV